MQVSGRTRLALDHGQEGWSCHRVASASTVKRSVGSDLSGLISKGADQHDSQWIPRQTGLLSDCNYEGLELG